MEKQKKNRVKQYFLSLNYSLANEDTSFERALILKNQPKKVVSVCGSGSRCLPLLADSVKELICVDLSEQQLWLAQLRLATIQNFNHEEFLLFWGYAPYKVSENTERRKQLFEALELDPSVRAYFSELFQTHQWKSVLYTGKWEQTFIFFSKVVKKILGEKTVEELFSFTNIEAQRRYLKKKFPKWRWKLLMAVLGNRAMFNAILYKGDFIQKNVPETYLQYYEQAYEHLMQHDLCRKSFFLQMCFLGEIRFVEGNLNEANPLVFDSMKKNAKTCEISFIKKDIISAVMEQKAVDFLSISDVPSYFADDIERDFLQMMKESLSPKALVVNRNYLRIPKADRSGYQEVIKQYKLEQAAETVQMYRIEVLQNEN